VLRGATFDNNASNVRSANRNNDVPTNRNNNYGLRVARTLPSPNPSARTRWSAPRCTVQTAVLRRGDFCLAAE